LPEQAAAVVAVAALPEQAAAVVAVAALPDNAAVIVPAVKLPPASLATMAFPVFADVAVVAVLATFPAVVICASFVSAMAAVLEMSALTMLVTVPESTREWSVAGVTSSPLVNVLPLVRVAMREEF
jgi:hypothetical protein